MRGHRPLSKQSQAKSSTYWLTYVYNVVAGRPSSLAFVSSTLVHHFKGTVEGAHTGSRKGLAVVGDQG